MYPRIRKKKESKYAKTPAEIDLGNCNFSYARYTVISFLPHLMIFVRRRHAA